MNLPWNVFITAVSYFHSRLSTTPFSSDFENIFTSTYTLCNLIFMLFVVMNARQSFFNMRGSVVVPQIITCLIFASQTVMVYVNIDQDTFFVSTVGMLAASGLAAALVQSGIFGLAGRFPPLYTQAIMSGQGIAGVIVSSTSLITAMSTPCVHGSLDFDGGNDSNGINTTSASSPSSSIVPVNPGKNSNIEQESFEYFLTATVVVAATVIGFLSLSWSHFGKYYAFSHNVEDELAAEEEEERREKRREEKREERRQATNEQQVGLIGQVGEMEKGGRRRNERNDGSSSSRYKDEDKEEDILRSPMTPVDGQLEEALLSDFSDLTPNSRAERYQNLRQQSILDSPVFQRTSDHPTSNESSPRGSNGSRRRSGIQRSGEEMDDEETNTASGGDGVRTPSELPTCALISLIGRHCFSVCLTFIVTLSVFPGITSEIRSEHNPTNQRCPNGVSRFPFGAGVWQAVFFLIFNVGDTLGRALASLGSLVPHRWLWLVAICRIGFIPLLLLCNLNTGNSSGGGGGSGGGGSLSPSSSSHHMTTNDHWNNHEENTSSSIPIIFGYFAHDIYPIIFMCLLAISNGYVASLEMMHSPNLVPKHEASRAGAIMAFFLVLGLVGGSLASFGIRAIACQCNPFVEQHPGGGHLW